MPWPTESSRGGFLTTSTIPAFVFLLARAHYSNVDSYIYSWNNSVCKCSAYNTTFAPLSHFSFFFVPSLPIRPQSLSLSLFVCLSCMRTTQLHVARPEATDGCSRRPVAKQQFVECTAWKLDTRREIQTVRVCHIHASLLFLCSPYVTVLYQIITRITYECVR